MVVRFESRRIFCPTATVPFTAVVTVDEDGTYTLCGTRLDETSDSCANCIREPGEFQPCPVEASLPRRVLTDQKAEKLESLLDNVPERVCVDTGLETEPGFLPTCEFRGRVETSFCTYGDLIGDFPQAIAEVGGFLRDLAHSNWPGS